MRVYRTHAWRDNVEVEDLGEAEPGYWRIRDEYGERVVPVDSLVFKDDIGDLL